MRSTNTTPPPTPRRTASPGGRQPDASDFKQKVIAACSATCLSLCNQLTPDQVLALQPDVVDQALGSRKSELVHIELPDNLTRWPSCIDVMSAVRSVRAFDFSGNLIDLQRILLGKDRHEEFKLDLWCARPDGGAELLILVPRGWKGLVKVDGCECEYEVREQVGELDEAAEGSPELVHPFPSPLIGPHVAREALVTSTEGCNERHFIQWSETVFVTLGLGTSEVENAFGRAELCESLYRAFVKRAGLATGDAEREASQMIHVALAGRDPTNISEAILAAAVTPGMVGDAKLQLLTQTRDERNRTLKDLMPLFGEEFTKAFNDLIEMLRWQ